VRDREQQAEEDGQAPPGEALVVDDPHRVLAHPTHYRSCGDRMLVLYDNPASSNALKVRFLLAELGLDYESREVPFAKPRPEWLTEWHPWGTIPGLEDGELRLGESNTILRYLAMRAGRDDLYPQEPAARARVDWLLDTWSTQVRPAVFPLELVALFTDSRDNAAIAAATGPAVEALSRVERLAGDAGYLVGDGLTIADCCAAPTLWRSRGLELPFEHWPRLALIRETHSSHPAFLAAGPVR
jgi:glutathione S-transferase